MTKENKILYLILALVLFFGFFIFLGSYPLLDVDETRYAHMAREMFKTGDFMTLYLNGEYFFEKPPLYFWLECLSFKILGVSELSLRLPLVLISILPLGLLFNLCRKIKGLRFAFITSCVLLTSLEYVLITKIAILDGVLTSFCTSSLICYFYTFFVTEKNKKFFWLLTYVFSALALLAKGIPGVIIPFGVVFISTVVFKTYKETFKYMPFGVALFLLISLPWHIVMLKIYPNLFFGEYIYKHHILRFLGSDVIDRNEPWYFYILTLLWGFIPHTLILLKAKNIKPDKFLTLNIISIFVILIFFSLSGAKLVTYILPIYPFLAVIASEIWVHYIEAGDKILKYSIFITNFMLILAAFLFPFAASFLLGGKTGNMHLMQVLLTLVSFYLIKSIIQNERFKTFIFQSLFMALLIGFVTPLAYKIDYSFGQDDLMKFAKIAKENNLSISTYLTGGRYSLLYYSELPYIKFQTKVGLNYFLDELNKENNLLIVRNKVVKNLPAKVKIKGVKYSVVEKN